MHLQFDRGTILLRGSKAKSFSHFPGAYWEPHTLALRFPARLHGQMLRELHRRHVAFTDEVAIPLDTFTGPMPVIGLSSTQEAILMAWTLSKRRGVAICPSHIGRIRLAIAAVIRLGLPALCLVPSPTRLERWMKAVFDILHRQPGRFDETKMDNRSINLATFEHACQKMQKLGDQFGLLIVDEVQHMGLGHYDEALNMCTAPCRLGITSTPLAEKAKHHLSELIGPIFFKST